MTDARALFAPLGPTYDRWSKVLSLGQDPRWRRFLVSRVPAHDRRVLDVATGTGLVAEESAGGGRLDELRERLVSLRLTENPPGIDEAEEAALELERALEPAPRLARPEYLDTVGAATRKLERALGDETSSPFTLAMRVAVGAVEELAQEVERNYKLALT